MTKFASFIEKRIQENGGVYFTGKSPSYADLMLFQLINVTAGGHWDYIDKNFYKQFPGIMATYAAVNAHEQVKAYYQAFSKSFSEKE